MKRIVVKVEVSLSRIVLTHLQSDVAVSKVRLRKVNEMRSEKNGAAREERREGKEVGGVEEDMREGGGRKEGRGKERRWEE